MLSSMQRQNISLVDSIVAIDQGSAWSVAFGLLCGARESDTRLVRGCGPGWATESTPITPPSTVREPSAAVRYRREPAAPIWEGRVPDKVVLSQSREFGSNGTFFTMAAHTGRSLFHSHSIDTTAVTNFWQGGAQCVEFRLSHLPPTPSSSTQRCTGYISEWRLGADVNGAGTSDRLVSTTRRPTTPTT